jgi:RimJ/RimL family protein N-acetyltransferase
MTHTIILNTDRLALCDALPSDINTIIEMESAPENRDYIEHGNYQQHLLEIQDPNFLVLIVVEKETENIVGYIISHIDNHSNSFELRRFVMQSKGLGYGKEAIIGLISFAFSVLDVHRLWLDVYPFNQPGINLYESIGMHKDGILRHSYLSHKYGYQDQIIYSVLANEWHHNVLNN